MFLRMDNGDSFVPGRTSTHHAGNA